MRTYLPPVSAINAELARRSLWQFVLQGWHAADPSTLLPNWHMEVVCRAIQDCLLGKSNPNLIINVPPGSAKSMLLSVMTPAWVWLTKPSWSAIFASGNPRVAVRDSVKCRNLIRSDWYQQTFKPSWHLSDTQDQKTLFQNTAGGSRLAIGANSAITGSRADAVIIDDALDATDANSPLAKANVNDWYINAYSNRLNNMSTGCRIVMGQRLAVDDLPGVLLKTGQYDSLVLPLEFDPSRADRRDIRIEPGENLFPDRYTPEVVAQEKAKGSMYWAGQYLQTPIDVSGGMFRLKDFRFYRNEGDPEIQWRPRGCSDAPAIVLPKDFQEIITSWDMAFKSTKTSDFVAGGLWGRDKANCFLLRNFNERTGFVGAVAAVREFSQVEVGSKRQKARQHIVEDAANGAAVVEVLKDELSGIVAVKPLGGKESRAAAVSPMIEAGQVYLPDGAPWLEEYLSQFIAFPRGANDDMVDQTSQALIRFQASKTSFAVRFAAATRNPGQLMGLRTP